MSEKILALASFLALFPSTSMLLGGTLVSSTSLAVSMTLEHFLRNISSGMLIAAVGVDFFPILLENRGSIETNILAITLGFVIGFLFMQFTATVTKHFSSVEDSRVAAIIVETCKRSHSEIRVSVPVPSSAALTTNGYYQQCPTNSEAEPKITPRTVLDDPDEEDFELSYRAVCSGRHRSQIRQLLKKLLYWSKKMDRAAAELVCQDGSDPKNWTKMEQMGEGIDRDIHRFQYVLDHCRRLIQGSEALGPALQSERTAGITLVHEDSKEHRDDLETGNGEIDRGDEVLSTLAANAYRRHWGPIEKRQGVKDGMKGLVEMVEHLLGHMEPEVIPPSMLREMHNHLNDLDDYLNRIHYRVETSFRRWQRIGELSVPPHGSSVPAGLMVPVLLDSFVDGFFIGLTATVSVRVSLILALVNTVEMGFLGVAVACRVRRCTASSAYLRRLCIAAPPFVLLSAAVVGSLLGLALSAATTPATDSGNNTVSVSENMLIPGLVSFATIPLLHLSVFELLVQLGDDMVASMGLFLGVFVVVVADTLSFV